METGRYSALVVGLDPELARSVTVALGLPDELVTCTAGPVTLELVAAFGYDAVIIGYPPAEFDLQRLLDAIRRPGSACRPSPVVLLAPGDLLLEASGYCGLGVNRVLDIDRAHETLRPVLEQLLRVAPRRSLRTVGRVEVFVGPRARLLLCQTVNISATGMLLRTGRGYPLGTEIAFEVMLPGDTRPLRGRGRIVRETIDRRERFAGVGVAFEALDRDSETRLRDHVDGVSV
jgi:hypothetical protein